MSAALPRGAMMTRNGKRDRTEKLSECLREALSMPGVATAMEVYKDAQRSLRIARQARAVGVQYRVVNASDTTPANYILE